ncbi:hypothetical protein E2C01_083888 [Portunus trituberculatus]|uniref:Uncharacterized protein n=1 Tax=Portunus trituberculatus TaxID=210409 RepID=A0A5B7ITP2_PORTR|nr:hypothetical protein [Portunus trituberculatus]
MNYKGYGAHEGRQEFSRLQAAPSAKFEEEGKGEEEEEEQHLLAGWETEDAARSLEEESGWSPPVMAS